MALRDLIKQQQDPTETITVRLPSSDLWKIDDLAASLDVTRQRLLCELVKEGLAKAEELFRDRDETEGEENGTNYFILNTNKSNDLETHKAMLENGAASAFCDPWKFQIERLQPGDKVFLYESGTGIVATGTVEGELEKLDYEGKAEEEYRKKLSPFKKVKPLTAKEIKQLINANLIFYRTLFHIPADFGVKIEKHLKAA